MSTAPVPEASSVVNATADDVGVIAPVLAAAFARDPVGEWMAPDPRSRIDRLTEFFSVELDRFTLPHGRVLHVPNRGAALWLPPGRWRVPPLLLLRSLPQLGRVFGRRTAVVLRGLGRIEHVHPRLPHWYLPFVGVAPRHQGRGVGSALLAAVLEECDRDGLPAYLEATRERNMALYLRHGFEVRAQLNLPGGPPLWPMWREPRRQS